jgi:DNA topoisomerase-1
MDTKKSLVIVESPTKAKTINKYLGKGYVVKSSMGHLVDLPKSRLAVDVDDDFRPDYITIRGRGKILTDLKKEAARSRKVYLAADSDREGEAISYHIKNALRKNTTEERIKRIVFNEITERAIREAIKHPRDIDTALVNAQKARRILDRLVGYSLSPLLWEKIKKGLSAGRVQSVALRSICEREDEIERFVPREYWTIDARFRKEERDFAARLVRWRGKKAEIGSEEEANEILRSVENERFLVSSVEERDRKRRPPAPFTTSKLQQAAGSRLGYPSRKTMLIAQQLYEGIGLKEGPVGLITYMRTDSVRVASVAQEEARSYIAEHFSPKFVPERPNVYKSRGSAQDAHEAIRPTLVNRTPDSVKAYLSRDQLRLYRLIWNQFVASQMSPAVMKQVSVDITADGGMFRANGQSVLFEGFLKVLKPEEKLEERVLPPLAVGEELKPLSVDKEVHFTEPPPRFTDATLVKFLEDSGIGRPSTYAPIISTLLSRFYIERRERQFIPTFLGRLTNDLLVKTFPDLLNVEFTSNMEKRLDEIAEGRLEWVELLRDFYEPFIDMVEDAKKNMENLKGITDEETGFTCEKCGRKMLKKLGKYGYFLACSGFPDCRNTKPLPLGKCPRNGCDGYVVQRSTKKKKKFYGCTNYPNCDFMTWDTPAVKNCPKCGSIMLQKSVSGEKLLVCQRTGCEHTEPVEPELPQKLMLKV